MEYQPKYTSMRDITKSTQFLNKKMLELENQSIELRLVDAVDQDEISDLEFSLAINLNALAKWDKCPQGLRWALFYHNRPKNWSDA